MVIGVWALLTLIIGALVVGFAAQLMGTPRFSYDWAFTAVAAFVGGFVAGQFLGPLSAWGPVWDGLYYLPAIIGAILAGAIVELVIRTTGEPVRA